MQTFAHCAMEPFEFSTDKESVTMTYVDISSLCYGALELDQNTYSVLTILFVNARA